MEIFRSVKLGINLDGERIDLVKMGLGIQRLGPGIFGSKFKVQGFRLQKYRVQRSNVTYLVYYYRIIELSNYLIAKLSNYRIIELSHCQIAELSNCRIIPLSNYRIPE
jgi:hypothetical protein